MEAKNKLTRSAFTAENTSAYWILKRIFSPKDVIYFPSTDDVCRLVMIRRNQCGVAAYHESLEVPKMILFSSEHGMTSCLYNLKTWISTFASCWSCWLLIWFKLITLLSCEAWCQYNLGQGGSFHFCAEVKKLHHASEFQFASLLPLQVHMKTDCFHFILQHF